MDENDLTTSSTMQPSTANVDDSILLQEAEKKQKALEKSRKAFQKLAKVSKIVGGLFFLTIFGLYIADRIARISPPPFNVVNEDDNNNTNTTTQPTWILYKDEGVKVFIKYLSEASLMPSKSPTLRVDVVYDRDTAYPTSASEEKLGQGYIFRVTPLNVGVRDIDSIANIKLSSFRNKCPTEAVFSKINEALVNTIDARKFEIQNCDSDYVIYYVPRFGIYYEVAMIYKGDFGYKQKYRATLEEMLRNFSFFPEDNIEPTGPFRTYINEDEGFLFIHPNLSFDCCSAPAPPADGSYKVAVLGDKETFKGKDSQDSLGIYIYQPRSMPSFEAVLIKQKQLLTEDYKVVNGVDPVVSEKEVEMGKYKGVWLKGYSWQKNDLVYAEIPDEHSRLRVFIFSIKNVSGEEWDKKVLDMLSSFETFERQN